MDMSGKRNWKRDAQERELDKFTIPYWDTSVSVDKSIAEIKRFLRNHGARKCMESWDADGEYESVQFVIEAPNIGEMPIKLPSDWQSLLRLHEKTLTRDSTDAQRKANEKRAIKASWRIIFFWIKSQITMVQMDLAKMEQVFLPYIVVDGEGHTAFEILQKNNFNGILQLPEKTEQA